MANPGSSLYRRAPVSPRAVSPQRIAQYDPYAPQLGYLSENIHRLLTERECAIFDRGLADYHRRRNIKAFVECLGLVLNTNQKRQLLLPIRDTYIKPSDLTKFNQLVQVQGLATSLRRKKKEEEKAKEVKKIEIKRDQGGEWGFNIRGGIEHGIGIFVSWVDKGSNAEKGGLRTGDQILKANDMNCDNISHYEAVSLMKGARKLRLWVLSHGRVPTSHMANKVYRWVDPDGRPTTPPPDPFEIQDQASKKDVKLLNDADERKVTVMVDGGQELGISIRGGAEHGLGIYISAVEEGSVAEQYGLKVGDQILEVNGVNFLGIVHGDAASALWAQPCMVMRLKDVGKLPHSRIATYGKTKWQTSPDNTMNKNSRPPQYEPPSPAFRSGVGTQMMLKQDRSIQGRDMMSEVARSVLSSQELATFQYYVNQYEQYGLPVDDLVTPLFDLLNTTEKLQLISEIRTIIKPQDLQRFNELTVHKEIAAKKAAKQTSTSGSIDDLVSKLSSQRTLRAGDEYSNGIQLHPVDPVDNSLLTGNGYLEDGGRDKVPQRLSPQRPGAPVFHIPPPPSSAPPATSTPDGHAPHGALSNTLKERRKWMDDTGAGGEWGDSSTLSSLHSPPGNQADIEARIREETEAQLRQQFEEKQRKLLQEQERKLMEEQREKEMTLSREREALERQLREMEERMKNTSAAANTSQGDPAEVEERVKQELEEKIWKEAEEHMRHEFEMKLRREKESIQKQARPTSQEFRDIEDRIRGDVEDKLQREYEDKMKKEEDKWKKKEEEDRRRKEDEKKAKREEEIQRLEAEEQAKIELEERIRKEAEAKARAEYEARLQHETEERARLAEEVKARKAMEERLEKERLEKEKAKQKDEPSREDIEEQRRLEQQRNRREREEKEEQDRLEQQRKAAEEERERREAEKQRKAEIEQKRRDNLRKREEERQQKEEQARKKREEAAAARKQQQQQQQQKQSQPPAATKKPEPQKVPVNFGDGSKPAAAKTKDQLIEEERRKAEEKLQRRMKKAQEEKKKTEPQPVEETDSAPAPSASSAPQESGESQAGYDNLNGTIFNVTVTKVCKRLGIAIDGGANTKQKAVIIREISAGGCAAQTGLGLTVGQQILEVNGQSLFGLKHKEVVMAIKNAFEGPLKTTTIDFTVLEQDE